jgi:hypothetical protein
VNALRNIDEGDIVGFVIHNENNEEDTQRDKRLVSVFGKKISYPQRLYGGSLKSWHSRMLDFMHWIL